MACSAWSQPLSSSRGPVNGKTHYRNSTGKSSLLKRFIVAASALVLAAGCGAPATPISIRNAANATAQPSEAPTSAALAATAVPATRPATEAATAAPTTDQMAGMSMGGTQAAATTASSGTAGGAAGSTATATPFVLANVLFGTQSASTTAATGVPPTPALTTIPPTPALTTIPLTPAPTTAAGTQAASASGGQGDPKHGQQIFTGVGTCSTCHDVAQGIQIVGPSLKGVATRAATRKPGMSASDYLHESIVNPNAYVVQGFVAGVMPQNFAKTLSAKDIDDLVAYLLTLK